MTIKVFVSPENIKNGKRANCTYCPIALAIREIIELGRYGQDVRVRKSHHWGRWIVEVFGGRDRFLPVELPEVAADFAQAFDSGETMFPIAFDLEVWQP